MLETEAGRGFDALRSLDTAIRDDIPAPTNRPRRYGALYLLRCGQSCNLQDYSMGSLRSTITYLRRRYSKRFVVRTLRDARPKTVRVWRTE